MPASKSVLSWVASGIAAVILLQTLFFKFTGSAESVFIFEQLGAEPFGRLASGVFELITAGLLLWPRTRALGGLGGVGVMSGAIGSHLVVLGIEVQGDGGLLFGLAVVTFACSAIVLWLHRTSLPVIGSKLEA